MIKPIPVSKNAFFLSIACKLVQNAGYVCIPCLWNIEKIDGVALVFITEFFLHPVSFTEFLLGKPMHYPEMQKAGIRFYVEQMFISHFLQTFIN